MNESLPKTKQQVIDKIKKSVNILVTVSKDPTVDDLAAAIGLTAMLNNIGKNATAIFSGAIPPAITFLEPDKVFEGTVDSLRDFIIALDKEKADHLRYKLDGDVVKIFITPYKTTISEADLQFSQGDFNVELVLALGITNKENLDDAIASHGQIVKDITVATLTAGEQASDLGEIIWHENEASSLSELVVSLADSLKTDKQLLDKQISTALLTGIVFATDRFSNVRTTARVMTMAAQLMGAGADQQLIAARLNEAHELKPDTVIGSVKNISEEDGLLDLPGMNETLEDGSEEIKDPSVLGELRIEHETEPTSTLPPEIVIEESAPVVEAEPISDGGEVIPEIVEPNGRVPLSVEPVGVVGEPTDDSPADASDVTQADPSGGGREYLASPDRNTAINSNVQPAEESKGMNVVAQANAPIMNGTEADTALSTIAPTIQPLNEPVISGEVSTLPPEEVLPTAEAPTQAEVTTLEEPAPASTLSPRDEEEAKQSVQAIFDNQSTALPLTSTDEIGLPLPPPLPDFSTALPVNDISQFDFQDSALPPTDIVADSVIEDNPAQFRIPGQ